MVNEYNYLVHMKKGGSKENHKYISRVWKNGRWFYTYESKNNKLAQLRREEINSRMDRARTSNSFYEKRKREDINDANSSYYPDAVNNVKRWYSDQGLAGRKQFKKDDYSGLYKGSKTKYKTTDVEIKTNNKNIYAKTANGRIDSFMEKHGNSIASSLNATSEKKQKAVNFVKSKIK